MLKGGIFFLALAFLVIFLPQEIQAQTSSCSYNVCDDLSAQACIQKKKAQVPAGQSPLGGAQVQYSIIITSPKTNQTTIDSQTEPVTLELDSDKIFDLINQYRASQGLAPFEQEESVCQLAQVRSTELAGELSNGTIHAGLYNRNFPYWIWENAKVGSNEEETVSWWLASPLHHQSIVGDYKYSCVKCTGNNCSELFTSFSPK